MTNKEEFLNFFKINPDGQQAEENDFNMENKMRKATTNKTNTTKATKSVKATKATVASELKIEKGIAMPAARKGASEFTAVARKMNVGDSVKVSELPKSLYQTGKKLGYKFSNRRTEDNTFRIWRVQ